MKRLLSLRSFFHLFSKKRNIGGVCVPIFPTNRDSIAGGSVKPQHSTANLLAWRTKSFRSHPTCWEQPMRGDNKHCEIRRRARNVAHTKKRGRCVGPCVHSVFGDKGKRGWVVRVSASASAWCVCVCVCLTRLALPLPNSLYYF
jgi:hypothetical protein